MDVQEASPGDTILTTKLQVPKLRANYVPRPRLVARLQEGLPRKLTLISTPPGFGKTSLLCEWIRQSQFPAAWVSLDEADNHHGRFISYVMSALRSLDIGLDEHFQAISLAAAAGVPLESPMAALINGLSSLPELPAPIVLVLDDYHLIRNQDIHQSMIYALEYLPQRFHVVFATRTDPPLPLSRLRVRGQLNELRAEELRFTRQEAEAFLVKASGLKLSSQQAAALEERTEGWIAGLQLAALALNGRQDIDHFVHAFTGSHRYILDYLSDEVFSQQPEEVQNFLVETSILDRMCTGLCDAVTGLKNGQAMLERLERENLFTIALDNQRHWYRYHHFFADLLKNRIAEFAEPEVFDLHNRASNWFDEHQQPYDAIGHALAAKNYSLAIDRMVKATPALIMRSEVKTLLKWLNALPQDLKQANPRISLMYAWAHFFMANIDAVEAHIGNALHARQMSEVGPEAWPAGASGEDAGLLAQTNALRTFIAVNQGDPEYGIRIGKYALSRASEEDRMGRFSVLAALGDAYRDADNFAAASQTYAEALSAAEEIDQSVANLTMRMDLARLWYKMGRLRYAEASCREVLACDEDRYHPLFPVVNAYSLLGEILRERNELEKAEQVLSTGIRQCEWAGYLRYLVFSYVSAARLKFAQRDLHTVKASLEAASQAAAVAGSATLRALVDHFRARLLANQESAWSAEYRLSLDDQASFPHEEEYLTLVRVSLGRARRLRSPDLQPVISMLERFQRAARQSARMGSVIEILMLQALALQLQGRSPEALQCFDQSLSLAEPEGYVRLFVDEGAPVAELLLMAIQHNLRSEYARRLLRLIEADAPGKAEPAGLTEALTEREAEVLRLLAAGRSNQEIAESLVISLSTVKTHITRIYAKLEVASRTQAILKAQELKLL